MKTFFRILLALVLAVPAAIFIGFGFASAWLIDRAEKR